jgi:hypothetical protein
MPDTILSLIKGGVLRSVSVGFLPQVSRMPTEVDRQKFGNAITRVFTRWKLLELSVVTIPCNQDALIQAVSKGIITDSQAKSLGVSTPENPPEPPKPQPAPAKKRHIVIVDMGDGMQAAAEKAVDIAHARVLGKLYA